MTRVSLLWTFDEPRWLCEANEVISLSMDNIWRSTQLFYISAPLLLYSIIKGGVVKAYYCTLRAFVFFLIKVQWFSWCSASRSIVSEAVYSGVTAAMHRHPRLPAVPDVWWRHQLLGWWWPWRDVHQPCEVFRPKFRTTCCWGLWWIMQYDCVSPIQTNKKKHCYTMRHHQKIHENT